MRGLVVVAAGVIAVEASGCHGIVDTPLATVSVDPDSLRLWVGETAVLARVGPSLESDLQYQSSDTAVAQVSADGVIEGRGHGEAWIVATELDSRALPDSIHVIVDNWRVAVAQLGMTATVAKVGTAFTGRVEIRNEGTSTVRVGYAGLCMPYLVLSSESDGTRWNQLHWWNSRPGGCKWMAIEVLLVPGQRRVLSTPSAETAAILGDSLSYGQFRGEIRVTLAHARVSGSWTITAVDTVVSLSVGPIAVQPLE